MQISYLPKSVWEVLSKYEYNPVEDEISDIKTPDQLQRLLVTLC